LTVPMSALERWGRGWTARASLGIQPGSRGMARKRGDWAGYTRPVHAMLVSRHPALWRREGWLARVKMAQARDIAMIHLRDSLAWQRLRAVLSIAGIGLCALGCEREAEVPMIHPDQFVALRIYDVDTSREVVPDEADLIRVAHVDIGESRTQRVFKTVRYVKGGEPLLAKRLCHYAVARTGDGCEYALTIDAHTCTLAIEGQPGCYYIEGASLKELVSIYRVALGGVFIPRRLRPWSPKPGVPVPVRMGDNYGYADEYGKVVIQARFDDATPFSEGLAAVRVGGPEDGKWGYIDGTGDLVIEPQFAGASFFSEGLAAVTVDDFFDGKQGTSIARGLW